MSTPLTRSEIAAELNDLVQRIEASVPDDLEGLDDEKTEWYDFARLAGALRAIVAGVSQNDVWPMLSDEGRRIATQKIREGLARLAERYPER